MKILSFDHDKTIDIILFTGIMYNWKFLSLITFIGIIGCGLISCKNNAKTKTETNVNVIYTLMMSPDLLEFVIPQVYYVDENGLLVTVTGVEELDDKVSNNSAEINDDRICASTWSKHVTDTGYKCWTISMKFNHLNFHSYMGVKYLTKEFTKDTTDKEYDFHHSINTSINAVTTFISKDNYVTTNSTKIYSDSHTSIIGEDYNAGDDIDTYLYKLQNNPDKTGYYIDGNGAVSRKDDFEI